MQSQITKLTSALYTHGNFNIAPALANTFGLKYVAPSGSEPALKLTLRMEHILAWEAEMRVDELVEAAVAQILRLSSVESFFKSLRTSKHCKPNVPSFPPGLRSSSKSSQKPNHGFVLPIVVIYSLCWSFPVSLLCIAHCCTL